MEEASLTAVLLACSFWTCIYTILCYCYPRYSYEHHCRTVTLLHAVLLTALTYWCAFIQGPWPFTDPGGPNTPLQILSITVCLGYFIFDFAWCLWFRTEGVTMLIHHILSLLGLSITLLVGKYGTELVGTIFGSEISNPLLQARWFLRESGYYKTVWGDVIDISFFVLFTFMRIGLGSVLLYCYMTHPNTDYIGRMGGVGIYTVGVVFFIGITRFLFRKYTKRRKELKMSRHRDSHHQNDAMMDDNTADSVHELSINFTCVNGASKSKSPITLDSIKRNVPVINGIRKDVIFEVEGGICAHVNEDQCNGKINGIKKNA